MQNTSYILMVRPASFHFNVETALSNAFQKNNSDAGINDKARIEFDDAVKKIRSAGIDVTVIDDTIEPSKPDAVFPNNWISMHNDGTVVLYPMHAKNRRLERRMDIVEKIGERFSIKKIIDLSKFESEEKFLEGTGSCIFDHDHTIAYACLSPRTSKEVLDNLCNAIHYKPVLFTATDRNNKEIYHTNVLMCISRSFAIICLECVRDEAEKEMLRDQFLKTNKDIIEITFEQMQFFAGNMIGLQNKDGQEIIVLSATAYNSLNEAQIRIIEKHAVLLPVNIPVIEYCGGGSARCMIAEIFLPLQNRQQ